MNENQWIRARSIEQKEKRIQEIVSATERLYTKFSYEEITFVNIAKEAGFTRSNLYKYFQSKEEIFLEFLKSDLKKWQSDICNRMNEITYSMDDFSEVWVDILVENRRLIELISILYEHLEKHASYESLLDFKKSFTKYYSNVLEHLRGKISGFSDDKVSEFVNMQAAFGIGLYQMTDLSENQRKILEKPEYSHFKIDFKQTYLRSVKYLLKGILKDH